MPLPFASMRALILVFLVQEFIDALHHHHRNGFIRHVPFELHLVGHTVSQEVFTKLLRRHTSSLVTMYRETGCYEKGPIGLRFSAEG